MSRLLVLTSLDVAARRNNREHHVVSGLGDLYGEVWTVYRRSGRGLRDVLLPSVACKSEGKVHLVAVNPPLNPPEGSVRARLGEEAAGWRASLIDVVAIGKDIATVLALALAAWRHVPRGCACQAFGPWAAGAARILRRIGHIPAYVYVDRDYEPGFVTSAPRRRWASHMERAGLRHADLRLSIGERLRTLRTAQTGALVHLSSTGVERARFPPRLRCCPRAELIFVGRVAPWSGIEESIDALERLAPRHGDSRLRVFGPVPSGYRRQLEQRAARGGLGARVSFEGDVDQKRLSAEMDAAAVGLAVFRPVPLRIYAAPLKVMEYMANGLPTLALAGSQAGDLVAETGAGITCEAEAGSIAEAIESMLADPGRYAAMSRAGIAASERFEWAGILAREYALMTAVTAGAGPRSGQAPR